MLDDRAGDLGVGSLSSLGGCRCGGACAAALAWPPQFTASQHGPLSAPFAKVSIVKRRGLGEGARAELRRLLSLAWRAPGGRGSVRLCRRVGRLDRPAGARRARAKRARRAPRGPLLGGAPRDLPPGSRSVEKSLEWRPEGAKFSSVRALQRPPGAAPSGRRYHIILHSLQPGHVCASSLRFVT